jgi:hypothetical protein
MKLSIGTLIKYKSRDRTAVAIGVITRLNEADGTYTIHWTDYPDAWLSSITRVLAKVVENNNQPHHIHQYYILTRGIS